MLVRSGLEPATCRSADRRLSNGPYAGLRQTSKFQYQASFVSEILRFCTLGTLVFQLYSLGNSFMQNVATLQFQNWAAVIITNFCPH